MTPAHLHPSVRPALDAYARSSLTTSRRAMSRHRMLSARSPYVLGHSARYMCWWGKKRYGWFYSSFDHRLRKYLRRRGIDVSSTKPDAESSQRAADGYRYFSRGNGEKINDGSGEGQDPMDPFIKQREMMRRRMKTWRDLLERDPYEALFGPSNAMLQGRGWHHFWEEYVKEKEQAETQNQTKPDATASATRTGSPQPEFTYDPISGRMVMRDAEETTTDATAKRSSQDGAVDIPVKPFKGFSNPAESDTEEVDPLDSLHSALGEYEARHGLKSPKSAAESHIDPVREALDDYESRTRQKTPETPAPEAARLRDRLREYISQPDKNVPPDVIPEVNSSSNRGQDSARQLESASEASVSSFENPHPGLDGYPLGDDGAKQGGRMRKFFKDGGFASSFTEQQNCRVERAHPTKPQLPEDDIDMLQSSDVRANMGIVRHPWRKTPKEKKKERERLDREFDSAAKCDESEIVRKPSIPQKPILEADEATPPAKRISIEVEEQPPPSQPTPLKEQTVTNSPEPQPHNLPTNLHSRQLQPIQSSLDRLRYSYRAIKKDLAAQEEQHKIASMREENATKSTNSIINQESMNASKEPRSEAQLKEIYETPYGESQQAAPASDWDGRIDAEVHSCLEEYEQIEPQTVYRYSSSDNLDFDTPSHQGSTSSAKPEPSTPQANAPETDRMPSLESVLSSDPESIIIAYEGRPEGQPERLKIATHNSDIGGGLPAEAPAQAISNFVHPHLFFPYLSLLDKYDIVKSGHSLLVLRKRALPPPPPPSPPPPPLLAALRPPINPVDGTTVPLPEPPVGNFASPTGFVSYNSASAAPQSPQEPREEETAEEEQKSERSKSKGRGAASVAKTAIWAGAACYIAGVVGELVKEAGWMAGE